MKLSIKISFLFMGFSLGVVAFASAQVITLDSVLHVIDKQNPMLLEYDDKVKALTLNKTAPRSRAFSETIIGGPFSNLISATAESGIVPREGVLTGIRFNCSMLFR